MHVEWCCVVFRTPEGYRMARTPGRLPTGCTNLSVMSPDTEKPPVLNETCDIFIGLMTKTERSILRVALGREPRGRRDGRICRVCNRVVPGDEIEHCEERTWEFRSPYLRRFPRLPKNTVPPPHVVNCEYPSPHAHFVQGGRPDSNRRRH